MLTGCIKGRPVHYGRSGEQTKHCFNPVERAHISAVTSGQAGNVTFRLNVSVEAKLTLGPGEKWAPDVRI